MTQVDEVVLREVVNGLLESADSGGQPREEAARNVVKVAKGDDERKRRRLESLVFLAYAMEANRLNREPEYYPEPADVVDALVDALSEYVLVDAA